MSDQQPVKAIAVMRFTDPDMNRTYAEGAEIMLPRPHAALWQLEGWIQTDAKFSAEELRQAARQALERIDRQRGAKGQDDRQWLRIPKNAKTARRIAAALGLNEGGY